LTELGFAFALDNFGAGFGSFSYLKHLPCRYVEIDGAFVRGLATNPDDRAIVEATVQLARALGKKTVAEHVENDETLTLLRQCDVDFAQGYHIGRPLSLDELRKPLATIST